MASKRKVKLQDAGQRKEKWTLALVKDGRKISGSGLTLPENPKNLETKGQDVTPVIFDPKSKDVDAKIRAFCQLHRLELTNPEFMSA